MKERDTMATEVNNSKGEAEKVEQLYKEQDELLDELRAVASNYFREKRKRERMETSSALQSTSNALPTPPSPPLLRANEQRPLQQVQQNLQEQVQQETRSEIGEVLFDVSSLPPMQGYNVELMRDSNGGTYMKMYSK